MADKATLNGILWGILVTIVLHILQIPPGVILAVLIPVVIGILIGICIAVYVIENDKG